MRRSVSILLLWVLSDLGCAQHTVTTLGLSVRDVDAALAAHLDLDPAHALVVGHVVPERAAARAGLRVHDVITHLEGAPVDAASFCTALRQCRAGTPRRIRIIRRFEPLELTVEVEPPARFCLPSSDQGEVAAFQSELKSLVTRWRAQRQELSAERKARQSALRRVQGELQGLERAAEAMEEQRCADEDAAREARGEFERERDAIARARQRLDERAQCLAEREHAAEVQSTERAAEQELARRTLQFRREELQRERTRLESEMDGLGRRIAHLLRRLERPDFL